MPLIHTLEAPGTDLGGTLRLGLYDCKIKQNTVHISLMDKI